MSFEVFDDRPTLIPADFVLTIALRTIAMNVFVGCNFDNDTGGLINMDHNACVATTVTALWTPSTS